MVRADAIDDPRYTGWVFINWLYPGQNKFRAVKDVKAIEKRLRAEGLKGWFASSENEHRIMHTILMKMGAVPYSHDQHSFHFFKEVR
jgi:hypothetical protein